MGTVDQKLNDYVWDNLNELKSIFSEKVYRILLRFSKKEDKEGFSSSLELLDDDLLNKIKSQYEDIENMSLEEVANAIDITPYDDFIDKKKYIDRAEYWVKAYTKENEEYALLLNNLAGLYWRMKKYQKAEPLLSKALKIYKSILGEEHSDTATGYNNLALLYDEMREYQKAEPFFSKALEIYEKVLGKEHSDTATVYNNLALLYDNMKEYQKAEPLYHKALKITEKVLGKEHPYTATRYNNLAGFYHGIGEYQKAEPLYYQALKITENILKEKHPSTILILNNIDSLTDDANFSFKIDQIQIENFKQFNTHFSMQFSKQINIIIGQNAIGKTTLLQAITLGLLKENSPDEETSYTKYITKDREKSDIEVTYQENKKRKVTILKNRREIKETYNRPFVLAYGSNFFTDYIESDPIVQEMLNETIEKDFAHTIFLEHTDKFWNPLSILRNLAISNHDTAKDKKRTMLDTLNIFLEVEGYAIIPDNKDDTRFYFIKKSDQSQLTLSQLSEGYRGNVLLITDMLIKILGTGREPKTVNAVVLIDEFDKHLHPRWQSKLVDKLTDVFKNIQFIMTTHNPMSILDRNADEITKLVETKDGIKAVQGRGTKTIDISIVLLEYFGVESTISETMQKHINDFNKLKLKKELTIKEQEDLKELEKFLGNTVASNFIYDRKYLKFLEFIRDHKEIDFDRYEKMDDEEMDELLKDFGDFLND